MGVSKNSGTPKWMVKIMEIPIKMDDLGGKPTIFGNTHISSWESVEVDGLHKGEEALKMMEAPHL